MATDSEQAQQQPGYQFAGRHTLGPSIAVENAAGAIDWYVEVLGAVEVGDRFVGPDGEVGHAELRFGDSILELSDPHPDYGMRAPDPDDPLVSFSLGLYVPDADTTVALAEQKGATIQRAVRDEFYGDRTATIVDPFGVRWTVATHQRAVTDEEFREAVDRYRREGAPSVEDPPDPRPG